MNRKIEIVPAVRSRIPLFLGLWGPSGSGKTYSALRLALGIRNVNPGKIVFIDTENGRGRHYADMFEYEYVRFDPPFNPLDYLDVLKQVEAYKPSVIILDSFSHEHSGENGYLATHEAKSRELAEKWKTTPDKTTMPAWAFASGQRKELLRHIVRMNSNLIACFRAKEKNAPVKGQNGKTTIENLGYMPEAGKEYVFEMTLSCLIPPGTQGRAFFQTGNKGEDMMTKLPEQFKKTFQEDGIQLSEQIGEQLALWAKGSPDPKQAPEVSALIKAHENDFKELSYESFEDPEGDLVDRSLTEWAIYFESDVFKSSILSWALKQPKGGKSIALEIINREFMTDEFSAEKGTLELYFLHPKIAKYALPSGVLLKDHAVNQVFPSGNIESVKEMIVQAYNFLRSVK